MSIRVLVLRAAGINCDLETVRAWELVGARAERLHVFRLLERPALLDEYQIVTIPGGFSYGDDVAAGRILANQLRFRLGDRLRQFVERDRLILGICNGFQVLAKSRLFDGGPAPTVTVTYNGTARFEDRWVHVRVETDRSPFLESGSLFYLPVAHAEGKVVVRDDESLRDLCQSGRVALRYVDANGNPGDFPINPNGSIDHIAGLIDTTGRILGLMPHPERHAHRTHHPLWTRLLRTCQPDGLAVFKNAVKHFG